MNELKPSDFAQVFPFMSRLGKREIENIVFDTMNYLAQNGDEFRAVEYEEYEQNTRHVSSTEKSYFKFATKYCASEEAARSFALRWANLEQILKKEKEEPTK